MRYFDEFGNEHTAEVEKLKAENKKLGIDLDNTCRKLATLERGKKKEEKPNGKA